MGMTANTNTSPNEGSPADPRAAPAESPSTPGERPWQSRRKHARHTMEIHVEVFELGDGGVPVREWSCRTMDISRGGLGLTSDRMVHRGRLLLLVMPDATGKGKRVMCGEVRSTAYEAGRGHVLGVEFTKMPESSALLAWRKSRGLLPTG
jgi:hypothetical protein